MLHRSSTMLGRVVGSSGARMVPQVSVATQGRLRAESCGQMVVSSGSAFVRSLKKWSTDGSNPYRDQRKEWVRMVDENGASHATGRRKTAVARVSLRPGGGRVTVNGRSLSEYFVTPALRAEAVMPLINASALLSYDCDMEVQGGGCSGQAQAARHGIAKCMQAQDPAFRPSLKAQGLLTRDPRAVERKKPGRRKARRAQQWVKR